jgi:hypothetical protein
MPTTGLSAADDRSNLGLTQFSLGCKFLGEGEECLTIPFEDAASFVLGCMHVGQLRSMKPHPILVARIAWFIAGL